MNGLLDGEYTTRKQMQLQQEMTELRQRTSREEKRLEGRPTTRRYDNNSTFQDRLNWRQVRKAYIQYWTRERR